jgi:hypothetical protein
VSDNNAKVRAIIERSIADLQAIGMDFDAALFLLAFQAAIRMEEAAVFKLLDDIKRAFESDDDAPPPPTEH